MDTRKIDALYMASTVGDVSTLNELMQQNPLILDRLSLSTLSETPLHISALRGHCDFARALLQEKPQLAAELDSFRCTPLHLASAAGHVETVKLLIDVYEDACLLPDQDGRLPLHYAAMRGKSEVAGLLVTRKPRSLKELAKGESAFHLCVRYNRLETLKKLVESKDSVRDFKLLRIKDLNAGNSVLHLAVMLRQRETVEYLMNIDEVKAESSIVNNANLTALDVLEQMSRRDLESFDIQHLLEEAGVRSAGRIENNVNSDDRDHQYGLLPEASLAIQLAQPDDSAAAADHNNDHNDIHVHDISNTNTNQTGRLTPMKIWPTVMRWWKLVFSKYKEHEMSWLKDAQQTLMVAATLIATMSFQATLSPPGGYLQQNETGFVGNYNCSVSSDLTVISGCWAGSPVLSFIWPTDYGLFMIWNTLSFSGSVIALLLVMSGFALSYRPCLLFLIMAMIFSILFASLAYIQILLLTLPDGLWFGFYFPMKIALYIFTAMLVLVGSFFVLRLLVALGKRIYKCCTRTGRNY